VSQTLTCKAAILRYWPADTRTDALAVSWLESGWNTHAHLYSTITGDDSYSCFQVNRYGSLAKSRPSAEWLTDPYNNVQYAAGMYRAQGWKPWLNSAHKLGLLK
jgi:hypothetical protein